MMKSFFKFLFCLLILFTGFSNTHAQSDTTKYKVYFKIDSTTVGEKAVLSMLTINKIDGAAISSFDVDSCFYLTKGLYKVEYVCQIGYQGDWYSAMRDIKSDTTITLKPLKGVDTSIGTEYALIFNLKWYDSESIAEIMHKINMKGVFNFHSKNTTEQYLENYLRD